MQSPSSRGQPLGSELELALACCRPRLRPEDRSVVHRVLPMVDVQAFLQLVIARHRIAPLVHANLKQLPDALLPAGLMAPLAASVRRNAVESLRAVRTHVLLARWFAEAGVEWLPFKGITLAQRWYGDPALRQMHDQDIWVPQAQVDAARGVLARHGFRWDRAARHWELAQRGPRHLAFLFDHYFEEQHYSDDFGFIELHWQLTGNRHQFALAPRELLRRADRVEIGGILLPMLNAADLLLYLCEHGGRHGWFRLKWLADLPQLLEHHPWDWPALFDQARAAGCQRSLLSGLSLARELLGWAPPPEVTRRIDAAPSLAHVNAFVRQALQMPMTGKGPLPIAWRARIVANDLLLAQNWRAAGTHIRRRLLSPKDLVVPAIPDRWFWLYWIAWPFTLCRRLWRGRQRGAPTP